MLDKGAAVMIPNLLTFTFLFNPSLLCVIKSWGRSCCFFFFFGFKLFKETNESLKAYK